MARKVAGGACVILDSALILTIGNNLYQTGYRKGFLHGKCPFSARSRLLGTSNVRGRGQVDCSIRVLALYGAMPVVFLLPRAIVMISLLHSLGSVPAMKLATRTLVVGWTYRLTERWVLDCNVPMNYLVNMKPSLVRTIGAAVFSPTAILHIWTGITLLAGYAHARSLDSQLGF
jgi:hypothetical protein